MNGTIKLFIFTVILHFSFARSDLSSRIVNGVDASIAEFPYIVSLRYGNSHNCAGSLLNDQWILTASHCLSRPANQMTVEFASTKITNGSNGTYIALVEKLIRHEDWNPIKLKNDIGLVKLLTPIKASLYGSSAKLASVESSYSTGTLTTVVGWGIKSNGQLSSILQKVDLQIYSYDDCKAAHSINPYGLDIYRSNICAGVPEMGKAECNGDSGGPLIVNGVQVGIVSWSIKPCAIAPYPGVYTNVASYIGWIQDQTEIQFQLETFLIRKL